MGLVDLDECIERVTKRELLGAEVIREICTKLKEVLVNESNVKHIAAPVTVVGDVHGQFYDLIELFGVGGHVPDTNYLFLGDYVDRGHHSVETISLLCCLKLRYPDRVNLIRGNHESRAVTQVTFLSLSYSSLSFSLNLPYSWAAKAIARLNTFLISLSLLSLSLLSSVLFCSLHSLSSSPAK